METNSSPYSISERLKKKKKNPPRKTYQQQKNANMEKKKKKNCKPVKSDYDSPKVTGQ